MPVITTTFFQNRTVTLTYNPLILSHQQTGFVHGREKVPYNRAVTIHNRGPQQTWRKKTSKVNLPLERLYHTYGKCTEDNSKDDKQFENTLFKCHLGEILRRRTDVISGNDLCTSGERKKGKYQIYKNILRRSNFSRLLKINAFSKIFEEIRNRAHPERTSEHLHRLHATEATPSGLRVSSTNAYSRALRNLLI